jgi:NadR type nicotinamide-nucleotide adenylyltransferase
MNAPKLVCILGAESTGKTTLARGLAAHFNAPWVPEYLREFCDVNQRTPTATEQTHIIEAQVAREASAIADANSMRADAKFVFCDTAPILTAIYSEFVFADHALYAQARALHQRYAITLLLTPDIAWIADGLQRDGEQVRQPITTMIERELVAAQAPFHWLSGERLTQAIEIVNAL